MSAAGAPGRPVGAGFEVWWVAMIDIGKIKKAQRPRTNMNMFHVWRTPLKRENSSHSARAAHSKAGQGS